MRAEHFADQIPDRFLTKIVMREDGCWSWIGNSDRHGYGLFKYDRRQRLVHRVAYELFVDAIPEGLEIDHLCRNRLCVNPSHLEPVPHLENMLRSPHFQGSGSGNPRKTACCKGHEFTPENTRYERSGRRYCRECKRLAGAAARRRRMAAREEAA